MKLIRKLRELFAWKISKKKNKRFWKKLFRDDLERAKLKELEEILSRYKMYLDHLELQRLKELGKPQHDINIPKLNEIIKNQIYWKARVEKLRDIIARGTFAEAEKEGFRFW